MDCEPFHVPVRNFPDNAFVPSAMLTIEYGRLGLLALVVACVSWTITKEEIFREFRLWCRTASDAEATWFWRKVFYIWTCEYCFSHWVTAGVLTLTRYHLSYADWRGYVLAEFAIVWIANVLMTLFSVLRQLQRGLMNWHR